ncbi:MAG: tyrosine-protein phosphatase [Bacteroidales bacterium]|nr:tyrosine-protein phosphatase [Bacteroidales bacterium]
MIAFDSIPNARELGGLRMKDGRLVRHGMLYRTAYLSFASDEDLRRLSEEFHIKKVIDLRSTHEITHKPDRMIKGSEYSQIEIITLNGHLFKGMSKFFQGDITFEEGMSRFVMEPAAKMLCDDFYISFVDAPDCQESFEKFFREILSAKGPVLWHCTQGKDRTGLSAAFLLHALGADRSTIMYDFNLTNDYYAHDIDVLDYMVAKLGGGPEEFACVRTLVGVNSKLFVDALDWIDSKFGGMDSYIKNQLHVSEADINTLRERYLL